MPVFGVFLVCIFHIRTEYGEIRSISESIRMGQNTEQKNSEHQNFSSSAKCTEYWKLSLISLDLLFPKTPQTTISMKLLRVYIPSCGDQGLLYVNLEGSTPIWGIWNLGTQNKVCHKIKNRFLNDVLIFFRMQKQ